MRHLTKLSLLTFFWLPCAIGNPIAVDSECRPASMTSEQVKIQVEPDYSTVSGDYAFRLRPNDWPGIAPTHVCVYVPVILTDKWAKRYDRIFGAPVTTTAGRDFPARMRNDLAFGDSRKSIKLPKGWFLLIYEAKIPLRYVPKNFDIRLKYIQPNFTGDHVGYVPFLPPQNLAKARISFSAPAEQSLRKDGWLSAFSPKRSMIEFSPKDRRLISVVQKR